MAKYWYSYSGFGNEISPFNYWRMFEGIDPSWECFGGNQTCAVYAEAGIVNPNIPQQFSWKLQDYIIAAKNTQRPYPWWDPEVYVRQAF